MDIQQLQEQLINLQSKKKDYQYNIDDLKNKQQDLSTLIEDENLSVEKLTCTIDTLQETLFTMSELLEKHENQLDYIENKIKDNEKQLSEIDNLILEKDEQLRKIQNDALCQKSFTINKDNTFYALLKKNSNTTPIITKYCESDKEFMLLNAKMTLPNGKDFSYIIVRSNVKITSRKDNVPTMSELKSIAGKYLTGVHITRMEWLKQHILTAVKNNEKFFQNTIIPLSEPCLIGGQSDIDQMGYGWEWTWEYGMGDYIEGTYYGEMTGFSVIGIQINRSDYY